MSRVSSSTRSGSGGRPVVAAFGKHPGWDDHTDYLGRDSSAIGAVHAWVYETGVRGSIEAGLWAKASQPVEFGHVLLCRVPVRGGGLGGGSELVAGRLWASRDGRGRDKYPMVVCAAGAASVAESLRSLESARAAMTAAGAGQAEVMRALATAESQLADPGAAAAPMSPLAPARVAAAIESLRSAGRLGEGGIGVYRVMWEVQRELAGFMATAGRATAKLAAGQAGHHIRVPGGPGGTAPQAQALETWLGFIAAQVAPGVPLIAIAPEDGAWVDVVIGEPTAELLSCVRLGPADLPLASDIPYEFPASFRDECDRTLAAWAGEQPLAAPAGAAPAGDDTGTRAGRRARPAVVIDETASLGERAAVGAAKPTGGRLHPGVLIGAGIAIVVIVVVIVLTLAGGGGSAGGGGGGGTGAGGSGRGPSRPVGAGGESGTAASTVAPRPTAPGGPGGPGADGNNTGSTGATEPGPRAALGALDSAVGTQVAVQVQPAAPGGPGAAAPTAPRPVGPAGRAAERWQTDAARRAWKAAEARAADPTPGETERAKRRLDQLAELLVRIERAVPGLPADAPALDGVDSAAVLAVADAERSRVVDSLLQEAAGLDPESKAFADRLAGAAELQRQWVDRSGAVLAAAAELTELLSQGWAWATPAPGRGSPEQAWARLKSMPATGEFRGAMGLLVARCERLAVLSGSRDRAALLSRLGSGVGAESSTALAALRAMGPSQDLAQLTELRAAAERVLAAPPAPRAPGSESAREMLRAVIRADWAALVAGANDVQTLRRVVAAMPADPDRGPALASLDARGRWNVRVAMLAEELAGVDGDQAARAALGRFVNAASADAGSLGPRAAAFTASLAALVPEQTRPVFAPERDGPASDPATGWRFEGVAAGGTPELGPLVYSTAGLGGRPPRRVEFSSVEVEGRRVWIADREVSVGLFADVVTARGASSRLAGLLPLEMIDGDTQEWAGPRAWGVRGIAGAGRVDWATLAPNTERGREPGRGWLHVPPAAMALRLYPEPDRIAPPTDDSPMQMVSPEAAVLMARLMNCRLPTPAEFAAAVRESTAPPPGSPAAPLPANLRDPAFERAWQHLKAAVGQLDFADPLVSAFRGAAPFAGEWRDAGFAAGPEDGVVWFDGVSAQRGHRFRSIVGNVAEFVMPVEAQAALDPSAPRRQPEWVRAGSVAVAGGSALSPPGLFQDPGKAVPVPPSPGAESAPQGFGDVGFRLAFTPRADGDRRPVRVQAEGLIEREGFVLGTAGVGSPSSNAGGGP